MEPPEIHPSRYSSGRLRRVYSTDAWCTSAAQELRFALSPTAPDQQGDAEQVLTFYAAKRAVPQ
jgi:hypothetical protein